MRMFGLSGWFASVVFCLALAGCGGGGGGSTPSTGGGGSSTYSISGTITLNGTALAGVTVSTGSASATTDANGNYTISSLASGSFTVTPTKTGYTFTPATLSITVSTNLTSQNFTATASSSGGSNISKLPKTGYTTCYDGNGAAISCAGAGQDGTYQAGVAWPNPRFTDNGDQSVTDKLTGLMWTKSASSPGPSACTPGVAKTWQGALDHVKCLNTNNYLGYNDWRLPNINELASLTTYLNTSSSTQQVLNDNDAWSSTTEMWSAGKAYVLSAANSYGDGISGTAIAPNIYTTLIAQDEKTRSNYAWPVRSGLLYATTATKPLTTGEVKCYDQTGVERSCSGTGEDGETLKGASLPAQRFTVNSDQTISDSVSSLIWPKDLSISGPATCGTNSGKSLQQALDYISCLNSNNFLGYNDWRLPNINELHSLSSFTLNPYAWLSSQGFINTSASVSNWSSSTLSGTDSAHTPVRGAMIFEMNTSGTWVANQLSHYSAIPVRSGI